MSRRTVETKSYEKQYQDKKTNEWKSIKIDLAHVGDRLLQFREDNPSSKVLSKHKFESNGTTTMRTYLWKDKKDAIIHEGQVVLDSADAVGTANDVTVSERGGQISVVNKALEKLETISTGRALASLGYMKDGQIASTEEMEEFNSYKESKRLEAVEAAIDKLEACKTLDELKQAYIELAGMAPEPEVVKAKDAMKEKLSGSN